ncbi:MAG: hypothetical protein ACOXZT_02655 [Tissierellaceae bacterium]|jgi:uncharacterized Zn ribbon protein|nr:hypothetical protein [Tissierellia bacterium]
MLTFIHRLAIVLFIFSVAGYILVVIREKIFLKNNLIIIDNKHLTPEDLRETDINEFVFKGTRLKSGDEIKLVTKEKKKFSGTVIGAKKSEDTIHIITHDNDIVKCKVDNILKFRIVSRYGRFFNF